MVIWGVTAGTASDIEECEFCSANSGCGLIYRGVNWVTLGSHTGCHATGKLYWEFY